MSMQTDIKAISLADSGAVTDSRARVRSLLVEPGASAGSVVLKDGGTSGTTVMTLNTLAGGAPYSVYIPAEGVLFTSSIYATLTNAKVTAFFS